MHQFNRTVIGVAVGGTVGVAYHAASLLSDLTAPVSYPVRGLVGGGMLGLGIATELGCDEGTRGAAMLIGAAAFGFFNTCCIPLAPVIGVVNVLTTPVTVGALAIVGGVLGYTAK
jgi:hypothetical protein